MHNDLRGKVVLSLAVAGLLGLWGCQPSPPPEANNTEIRPAWETEYNHTAQHVVQDLGEAGVKSAQTLREQAKTPLEIAKSSILLAVSQQKRKDFDGAIQELRDTRDELKSLAGPSHEATLMVMGQLGQAYQYKPGSGPAKKATLMLAESHYKQVLDRGTSILGEDHSLILTTQANLGVLWLEQRKWQEAAQQLEMVLEQQVEALGKDHILVLNTTKSLAKAYAGLHAFEKAEALQRYVIDTLTRLHGETHGAVAVAWRELGHQLDQASEVKRAGEAYRHALSIFSSQSAPDIHEWLVTLRDTGDHYMGLRQFGVAQLFYGKAETLVDEFKMELNGSVARWKYQLLQRKNQLKKAEKEAKNTPKPPEN